MPSKVISRNHFTTVYPTLPISNVARPKTETPAAPTDGTSKTVVTICR
jgi:hypothetical protein